MSRIRADRYTNRLGTGAPLFANGVNVTGNVGVGTTVPTSKLSVIGDMNVTGGSVGVGTTNPQDILHVYGTATNFTALAAIESSAQNDGILQISGPNIFSGAGVGHLDLGQNANGATVTADSTGSGSNHLIFQSTSNGITEERLRITSAGNIGIGDNSPDHELVVRGSQPFLEIRDNRNQNWSQNDVFSGILFSSEDVYGGNQNQIPHGFIKAVHTRAGSNHATSDAGLTFGTSASTTSAAIERLRITSDGKVGIATANPDDILTVKGANGTGIRVGDYTANILLGTGAGPVGRLYTLTNHDLIFGTNDAERLRITSTGDVGVGVVSPEARLHVEENLSHSSTYYLNTDAHILVDNPGSGKAVIKLEGEAAIVYGAGTNNLIFADRQNERLRINSDGDMLPGGDNSQDLGSSSKRWQNIYTADLQMSNEGSANDVDGTWGKYTIQEGENDLFLINRRSGKRYKFNLTEVN